MPDAHENKQRLPRNREMNDGESINGPYAGLIGNNFRQARIADIVSP
jgi:hypothetical protein